MQRPWRRLKSMESSSMMNSFRQTGTGLFENVKRVNLHLHQDAGQWNVLDYLRYGITGLRSWNRKKKHGGIISKTGIIPFRKGHLSSLSGLKDKTPMPNWRDYI